MALVNDIVKSLKKAPKKLKKGLKVLLMTPKIILQGFKRLWQIIYDVATRLQILPIDTLSGKLLAAVEVLFVTNLVVGVVYAVGRYRGPESLVSIARGVVIYPLSAFILLGIGFLITFPLDQRGIVRAIIVRSKIRQLNRISTGLVSVLIGILTAVFVTFVVGNRLFAPEAGARSLFVSTAGLRTPYTLELGFWPILFVFFVSVITATTLVYQSLNRRTVNYTRTDLSIVEVDESADTTLLRVRNDSKERIGLSGAKIEDSTGEYYTLNRDLMLRPGETITLTLPEQFTLETTDLEVPVGLSILYDDKRVTSIYTLSGETFLLEWGEDTDLD